MSKAIKKVAMVAVGAVIGFATGGIGFALAGAAIGLALGSFQAEMPKVGRQNNEPSSQTLRSSKAAARYILGRVSTGGVLAWAQEQSGDQTEGEWLHLVFVLSEGAIAGVDDVILNEESISTYGANATYEVVIDPSTVNAFLKANCPDWKDTQIGKGISFVRVSLKYSAEKFPSGIPDTRFIVRGRTDIYDPRTGNTGYSENAALLILWYLRNVCQVPDDEIIMPSFSSAANVCAESVGNPDETSSTRYVLGAVVGDDERRPDVLQKMLDACAGRLIRVGGRWMLQVGAYYGPYDFTVNEDMVIGSVSGTTEVDNDGAINTITGTFIDPQQNWAETDYPAVQVSEWVAEDGAELSESLDLAYVNNPYQAQRLANIKLRQRRSGGEVRIPLNFAGYNCRPGRVVRLDLPTLNISGEFIVSEWAMSATEACSVTLEAYNADMFDDAVGQPYDPLGFINLPAGGIAPPTGLAFTPDLTPEVRQGVFSWVPPFGEISYFGVVIRNFDGDAVQTYQVPGAASSCQVQGLSADSYTFSVFARSATGKSAEATLSVSIQGPPQPQSVNVEAGFDSITLTPNNLTGLNGGTYEYWYSLTPVGDPLTAIRLGTGGSYTHNGLALNTPYHYYVRTINAYGASAFFYVLAQTDSDPDKMLEILTGQITESQLGQYLTGEVDKISGDGPGSVNERISEAIATVSDALAYDPAVTYAEGDTVRGGPNGRRLYQALVSVPAAPDGSNAPPNPALWMDIGQVVEDANGVVTELNQTKARVETVEGQVTAQGESISALRAETRPKRADGEKADALRGWETQASYAQSVRVQATDREASVARDTQLSASVGDVGARLTTEEQVRATADSALAERSTRLEARMPAGTGLLASSASVETVATAQASLESGLSTMWAVKMQTDNQGRLVTAGIGLGIDGTTQQSAFYVLADQFAVMSAINGVPTTIFTTVGTQTILRSTVIGDATIGSAKFTEWLESTAVGPGGVPVLRLNFRTGEIQMNNLVAGGGRMTLNNRVLQVFDSNNILRVRLGIWG